MTTPGQLPAQPAALPAGELRIASVNLQHGGLDQGPGGDRRWRASITALAGWQPHIVLVQEMTALAPAGLPAHLWATALALDMIPVLGPASPVSYTGLRTAILISWHAGLRILDADPPATPPGGTGPAYSHATLAIPGLARPVDAYSVHLPATSAIAQLQQAETLATRIARADADVLAVAGGDWNSYAPGEPAITPGWLATLPRHLRPSRTRTDDTGRLHPRYEVHQTLTAVGLDDIAAALPPGRRTPRELAGTGNYPHGRIDRFYATPGITRAAVSYQQAATGGSDHQALLLTLDLAALAALTPRDPAP